MLKLIFLLILSVSFVHAEKKVDDSKVEIYATTMETKDNIVTATGEVVVVYKDYNLNAKKAIYNRVTGDLELFDKINATKGNNVKLLGEYAKMNIANKERMFKPFYMLEKTSNVWLSGCESNAKDMEVIVKSGVMSGCDPVNPLWKMEFTSAEYNTDTMWLDLYNARVYIYDIPVFYTPYFGYSLDTTRRTGLLAPMMGYSQKEGFYYEQALYIAEQNWWDLELKPQIRTNRGEGLYSTFRFIDTKSSKGSLSLGYFKEKQNYLIANDNELANDKHYGFDFNYNNSNFINEWFGLSLDGQSGIYADIHDMNDVEYINLSTNDTVGTVTTTQILSRINMFYNTDNNYFGTYFKYFKDLTLDSNDGTLQNLPAVHYHSYLDTFLDNHFLYSLDIKSNNYYRGTGKNAIQTDLNIPLTLQTPLFDEHMNLSYKVNLYGQHTSFSGNDTTVTNVYDDGYLARDTHTISLSSQLTKAYDELTHVVDFGADYKFSGSENLDGYYDDQKDYCALDIHKNESICEFYSVSDAEEKIQLHFSQYIYNSVGKQIIYHRLAQSLEDKNINTGVGELENELDYQITDSISYYNNMFYNYDEGTISKNLNVLKYEDETVAFSISHLYRNTFLPKTTTYTPYTSYMSSSITYKYNNRYTYSANIAYDLERSEKKSSEIGFLYSKRCWDFGIRYVENNRPILNTSGITDNVYDRYIFFTIALKPIMSSGQNSSGFVYKIPDKSTGG